MAAKDVRFSGDARERMLRGVDNISCSARGVISVENSSSFNEMVTVLPAGVIVVYTSGFASPSVTALLGQIKQVSPGARFFHWGDCDAGGLRILAHLRTSPGIQIGALAMNAELIQEHQYATQPLTPNDRSSLTQLRAMPALSDCINSPRPEYCSGAGGGPRRTDHAGVAK